MLGLDPLYVANEGLFVTVVKKESAENILKYLQHIENIIFLIIRLMIYLLLIHVIKY